MSRVAAIQMASGPNVGANLIEADRLISRAVDAGAELVVLPENFAHMGVSEQEKLKFAEDEGSGKIQDFLKEKSQKLGVWIVGGTLPMKCQDPNKVRAACLVIDNKGKQVARYDKIHLFDVAVPDAEESYAESTAIEPGSETVVIDTPIGKMGVAVCYDLRFPELFRQMHDQGVEVFAVPSAFTAITGRAHWEIIVRARAVENLSFVVAAAQGGYHVSGRETHGDSMIVDPWGNVLDRLQRGSGFVIAELDLKRLKSIRRNFPVLEHRKL
ncbi:MAG: carbon-nitrogen hydrolase family protein [Gammaproteobacteria bacterium]|nr:carbon-nitrogen hydrolase family protein [Gammaproteobacteria bacterium]MDH5730783.1 carbon-nitrogen hydrolase family protein [Gammaproteobacteria bacterium]